MKQPRMDFASWLKDHPRPSLEEMIEKYGGFDKVPREAWDEWEIACKRWDNERITRG